MSKYKEINLEEGMPTVDESMSYLKMSITLCKQNKIGCLAVIHGYGSSGKGGAIRAKARQWLNAQVRNGTIKAVINGEDFDIFNFKALDKDTKTAVSPESRFLMNFFHTRRSVLSQLSKCTFAHSVLLNASLHFC